MAIYTVKYRTQTGALAEDQIEAESRSAAFAALKAKGIVPVSLTEGGKKKVVSKPAKEPDAPASSAPGGSFSPSIRSISPPPFRFYPLPLIVVCRRAKRKEKSGILGKS